MALDKPVRSTTSGIESNAFSTTTPRTINAAGRATNRLWHSDADVVVRVRLNVSVLISVRLDVSVPTVVVLRFEYDFRILTPDIPESVECPRRC